MSGSPNKTICFITEQLNQMKLKRDDVKAPDYRTVTANRLDIICFSSWIVVKVSLPVNKE